MSRRNQSPRSDIGACNHEEGCGQTSVKLRNNKKQKKSGALPFVKIDIRNSQSRCTSDRRATGPFACQWNQQGKLQLILDKLGQVDFELDCCVNL